MKTKKWFWGIALITIIVAVMGCSNKDARLAGGGRSSAKLAGIWVDEDGDTFFELFTDGTGKIGMDTILGGITWSVENNRLKIAALLGVVTQVYDYKLSGSKLTLTDKDNDETILYKKK
jgi:hypothetical protein